MNWTKLWMSLFGTTEWMGLNIGFWVSMGVSLLAALLMILVFWAQKPFRKPEADEHDCTVPADSDGI